MNALAEALVYAIHHIETRPSTDEDSDVAALEAIGAALQSASDEEKAVLGIEAKKLGYPELPGNLGL